MSETKTRPSQNAFDSKMRPRPSESDLETDLQTKSDLEYYNTKWDSTDIQLSLTFSTPLLCFSVLIMFCVSAQKIHASSETYLALVKDNSYELQLRGEIEVKVNTPCREIHFSLAVS